MVTLLSQSDPSPPGGGLLFDRPTPPAVAPPIVHLPPLCYTPPAEGRRPQGAPITNHNDSEATAYLAADASARTLRAQPRATDPQPH